MSLIKLATSFPELRKVAFNLVYVTILDCNGVLAGTQGIDLRFTYPEFYDYYREVVSENYSDATSATELLGSIIYSNDVLGIFGTCNIVTKDVNKDESSGVIDMVDMGNLKFTSISKCEFNEEAIRKGISAVNAFVLKNEWNNKVLTYPCITTASDDDGKRLLEILEDVYTCNDQFQVIATNEKIGEW